MSDDAARPTPCECPAVLAALPVRMGRLNPPLRARSKVKLLPLLLLLPVAPTEPPAFPSAFAFAFAFALLMKDAEVPRGKSEPPGMRLPETVPPRDVGLAEACTARGDRIIPEEPSDKSA